MNNSVCSNPPVQYIYRDDDARDYGGDARAIRIGGLGINNLSLPKVCG